MISGTPGGTGVIKTVTYPLPPKTAGTTITYEVDMSQGQRALTPRVTSLAITYERVGPASGTGGGGEGGNNKGANGSGTYSYPGSGGGSGQGSGGGIGGGSGSGSGAGTGTGYGSGSSASTMGADTGSSTGSATGADLPSSVNPAATAPGSESAVSGYAMKASGFAGGGEGGGSAADDQSTAAGWLVVPAILGLLGLAVMTCAVLSERRRVRAYAAYDAARPRPLPAEAGTPPARALPPPIVRM